jgi:hypothetical protein
MSWTCPDCKKEFRNRNQWHSCARTDVDEHLRDKSPEVVALFEKLMRELRRLGEIALNPVKTSIQIRAGATFLSIRVKKDHLEIDFQLDREVKEFPVYRAVRVSKSRVLHFAVLESPGDIDEQLVGWLRESYELIK